MKHKQLLCLLAILSTGINTKAQNTSPYWSLAGNSNATTTSKLGTTNGVSLRFFANNIQRMLIGYNSGNVSIGTTSLNARLTVNAAAGTSPILGQINGATKLYAASNGGLSVGSGSLPPTNGLYVAGNLGIGNATAAAKLHVEGNANITLGLNVADKGIWAVNNSGTGVYGTGTYNGVTGNATDYINGGKGVVGYGQIAIYGVGKDYGFYGNATNKEGGSGVYGQAEGVGNGVYGVGHFGVVGITFSDSLGGGGVGGYAYGRSGLGINAYSRYGMAIFSSTGNSESYAAYFNGNVFSSGTYTGSDRSLKKDIADVSSALEIIGKLKPKSYTYRQDSNYKLMNLPSGNHFGLIAQEVENLLPSLVKISTFNVAMAKRISNVKTKGMVINEGPAEIIEFKAVNYTELIPIVVKGIQELDAKSQEIETLKTEIDYLKERLSKLETLLTQNNATTKITSAFLEQNIPNPARGNTTIRYSISERSKSASLVLTNTKGQIVKSISISSKGIGQVNLMTSILASGTYSYTLYVDGKQIDTKQLVIAK